MYQTNQWYSGVTKKTPAEFCCLVEKGHVEKESEVITQGMREMEVGTLAR